MEIAAKYPAAREAQIARAAEVQDRVAEAFAQRHQKRSKDRITPRVLAALTLSLLNVIYQTWFETGQSDITPTVEQVLATVSDLARTPKTSAAKKSRKPSGARK